MHPPDFGLIPHNYLDFFKQSTLDYRATFEEGTYMHRMAGKINRCAHISRIYRTNPSIYTIS